MKQFEELNKSEQKNTFRNAVKQIVEDLAMGRVEFEDNTTAGREANTLLANCRSEYAKGAISFDKLKLRVAIGLKRHILSLALAAVQERSYYVNNETKELA